MTDMTAQLTALFEQALDALKSTGELSADAIAPIQLSRTKDKAYGDFACNIALMLAKPAKMNPRQLAQKIADSLPNDALIDKVEVAGAGFINVFLNAGAKFAVLETILAQKEQFGQSDVFCGKKLMVEFVSANPTSALHVGHGRGASYGMSLVNLLSAVGYDVWGEYYVNDMGRQMDILATSTYLRYLQLLGEPVVFPSNGYQGDYIKDIANDIIDMHQDKFRHHWVTIHKDVPSDAVYEDKMGEKVLISGDKEAHIDGLIDNSKSVLGKDYEVFHKQALTTILDDIKKDLAEFGVTFKQWFSEKSIAQDIKEALEVLDDNGYLYEKEGNIWFKSTEFGDEKDRVVKRSNGQTTYFASDIAYHKNKFDRGFDAVINVWGADHHGYIPRIKASLSAMGIDPNRLEVPLVQFVALYRGDTKVQMSSRSGQFITLRELREEVGNDAARYYYAARTPNVHMDFDLELAKSQSRDNPVYYIQYAHARICSVFDRLMALGYTQDDSLGRTHAHLLDKEGEMAIVKLLSAYPDTVMKAAIAREPHLVANYLKELAGAFHAWYNDNRILPAGLTDKTATEDELKLMQARLYLMKATRQVLVNGLTLLGLSAPASM